MKCPACARNLVPFSAGAFEIDMCRDGCGGIWFDKEELERCDENAEPFPPELFRVRRIADVVIDRNKVRSCPRCTDKKLQHVVLDTEQRFEIDHCAACGGNWLDIGELELMRSRDKEDKEMEARITQWNAKVKEQLKNPESARRVKGLISLLFK